MVRKAQLPVVGGVRKVIQVPGATTTVGTTIAEFGSATVTLAQLAAALNLMVPPNSGLVGNSDTATLTVGPGLSGGGPMLGNVPIRLTAPIPAFVFGDEGGGDDGIMAIPGRDGVTGATGAQGPQGAALFMLADDPDDFFFVPETNKLRTVNKGAVWPAGATNLVFVNCPVPGLIKNAKIVTAGGFGNCVIDIWKAPFTSFPPTIANTITAAALPTISGGVTYSDSTLVGWTTTINAGDVLAFKLNSSSVFTEIEIVLEIQQ